MSALENTPNNKEQLFEKQQEEQIEKEPLKIFQGETVLVKRSDGSIENDWTVSETPFPEEEFIKVYKKDPENPEHTLTKVILRADLESINGSEIDFTQAEDIDSLMQLVEKQGTLSGGNQEYSADTLKEIIEKVELGELEINFITRAGGLRDAFEKIKEKEQKEVNNFDEVLDKYSKNIALFESFMNSKSTDDEQSKETENTLYNNFKNQEIEMKKILSSISDKQEFQKAINKIVESGGSQVYKTLALALEGDEDSLKKVQETAIQINTSDMSVNKENNLWLMTNQILEKKENEQLSVDSKEEARDEEKLEYSTVETDQREKIDFNTLEKNQRETLLNGLTTADSKEMMQEALSYMKDSFEMPLFDKLSLALEGDESAMNELKERLNPDLYLNPETNSILGLRKKVFEFINQSQNKEQENPENEVSSPEIKFLQEEKVRLQQRLKKLEIEYKKNFQLVSKSELSWYESQISSLDRQIRSIPDKIEEEKKKLLKRESSKKAEKADNMEDFDMDNYLD